MTKPGKFVVGVGFLSLLSVLPLAAQVDKGVEFKTSFPFYAGAAKLPAGSYKITEPDMDLGVLQIQSTDGKTSVFVRFTPTETLRPHGKSAVTFHRYGDADYLDRAWLAGETDGIMLDQKRVRATVTPDGTVADPSSTRNGE